MSARPTDPPIKLGVIGAKGIGLQGGIETYCANFYRHLTPGLFDVTLFAPRGSESQAPDGLRIVTLRVPRLLWLEMPLVSLLAVIAARVRGIRLLHIHGVGAAICLPLARLLGCRTVVRYLGPEYEATQWGPVARAVLRLCERFVGLYADQVVCLSEHLAARLRAATGRTHGVHVAPNGVVEATGGEIGPKVQEVLAGGPYVLAVGRIVSAKNFHLLVEAFLRSDLPPETTLVIAGKIDFARGYREVMARAVAGNPRIRMIGTVFGADLWALYRHCRLYVLPSMHEGMSFSLLEAGLSGAAIITSDIPQNAEVCRGFARLVAVNSVEALQTALEEAWVAVRSPAVVAQQVAAFRSRHDWAAVAGQVEPILVALRSAGPRRPRGKLSAIAQEHA